MTRNTTPTPNVAPAASQPRAHGRQPTLSTLAAACGLTKDQMRHLCEREDRSETARVLRQLRASADPQFLAAITLYALPLLQGHTQGAQE